VNTRVTGRTSSPTLSCVSSPSLEPEVVAEYGRFALQNARDLVSDSEILIEHERWPRACSLAVLAAEEAAKAWMCGLMPVLPPDDAASFFAWPFAEINRAHGLKLGTAGLVTHMLGNLLAGVGPQGGIAPRWEDVEASSREDNERKQRGFYVGYRDGQILRPSELSEQDARRAVARARTLANIAEHFLDWTSHLPEELKAAREEIWARMVGAFERGGYEEMAELVAIDFGSLTEDDLAQVRAGVRALAEDLIEDDVRDTEAPKPS